MDKFTITTYKPLFDLQFQNLIIMPRPFVFSLLLVLVLSLESGCTNHSKTINISDLRCENLNAPLGIGTTLPQLSWKISSSVNGARQTAYQIIAAGSKSVLTEKKADVWNSGKVISSQSVLVPYNGVKLDSRSICYWKVKVWDQDGKPSAWSDISFFSVGLINKSDWSGEYIGLPDSSEYCISPQLWKTFFLENQPDMMFIHVNSLGYNEVWINGKKAGKNVLTPAVSQFNKRSQAVTYDISSLVQKGRNDIVIWLGQGWYSKGLPGVEENGPIVKAQVETPEADGWTILVSTDSTWKARNSGYSTIGSWRAGQFGGEQADASVILKDLTATSLDQADWLQAVVSEKQTGEVTPQSVEANRIIDTIRAVSVTKMRDSVWLTDMGKTLTGWFKIGFTGLPKGCKIRMDFCDHLDPEGNTVNQGQTDIFISGGNGNETFCNKFNYHGFRYVKISNLFEMPDKEKMEAYLIHTGYKSASTFECSDPEMNKIHDMINYTLRCLSLGGYLVDCPQIERLGYGGDGNASTETAQTMFDLDPLYRNWLQAWADCQREDGGMPHTAPNPYPAGGGPYWCGFIITASWRTYKNYGDLNILEKYYPAMQKWLGYVDKYSPDGLLRPWPETDYRTWYLGDWATPEGTDQKNEASVTLVNNCFLVICYEKMQKIAALLGKKEDEKTYKEKALSLKALIHEKFFDKTRSVYGSGSQIDLTYPLLAEIVPDTLKSAVRRNLYNVIMINHDGHIATGLVGIPVFTEWAVREREADLMYSILKKKGYPGYLYMLDNGATTTWEHWNGARSRIHNCYNGIGSWFYQALGGIIPDEENPGYKHVIIDPRMPEGISWVSAGKETPYGNVAVKWSRNYNSVKMNIAIPPGCTGSIHLPAGTLDYKVNGTAGDKDKSVFETGSGKFIVDCNLSKQ